MVVIRKFLRHKQPQDFHIEDSNLGIVSNLLSYLDATVSVIDSIASRWKLKPIVAVYLRREVNVNSSRQRYK
jgi:hypothetical protein